MEGSSTQEETELERTLEILIDVLDHQKQEIQEEHENFTNEAESKYAAVRKQLEDNYKGILDPIKYEAIRKELGDDYRSIFDQIQDFTKRRNQNLAKVTKWIQDEYLSG